MKSQAPRVIGKARVLFYTPIDSRHLPTGGCSHIVAGVEQGPAAGLAICQHGDEEGYYLFGCDSDWNPITDTWHETIEGAKAQAEFEYVGVSETWETHSGD